MNPGVRAALLDWYDQHQRDLPWRRSRDPYAIWVSEVMLQQTRVDTVIPYYERFLARFPTPATLAEAPEDAVLAAWSGLGYYRRARLLQAGAREVVERYGGEVPEEREARLSLPGVGRYTAGAIGSIAFDRPEPIVDGNVARVLSRMRYIETALGQADTERRLWDEAERAVLGERPGALNQALMELGATVCVPVRPRCDRCPLRRACAAHARGATDRLPVPKARKAPKRLALAAAVGVRKGEREEEVWLVRSDQALFGGLWGLPLAALPDAEPTDDASQSAAKLALAAAGGRGRIQPGPPGRVEHVLSHRHLVLSVHRFGAVRAEAGEGRRWVSLSGLGELGVSRLTVKLLGAAGVVHERKPTRKGGSLARREAAGPTEE